MSLVSAPHTCHHPTCTAVVPEAQLACEKHWFALPIAVRNDIWRAFRPGQEITKTPGANWWSAYAAAVEAWGFPEQAQRYRALVLRAERRESALRSIELENAIAADDDGWSDE